MTTPMENRSAGASIRSDHPEMHARWNGHSDAQVFWQDRTRLVLTPIAGPSILGLFGFFGATLIVGSNLAGWWGNSTTTAWYLAPFALVLGGLAQFLAGMWAYRARDALATAMHGTWGAFWLAWGMYELMVASSVLPAPPSGEHFPAFGFWFIPLAMITLSGALASLARDLGLFAVLSTLATGCGFTAAAFISGTLWPQHVGGWLFVFSAGFAWYVATAMMLESTTGRVILPVGKWNLHANVPGVHDTYPIEYHEGMPGARVGQ